MTGRNQLAGTLREIHKCTLLFNRVVVRIQDADTDNIHGHGEVAEIQGFFIAIQCAAFANRYAGQFIGVIICDVVATGAGTKKVLDIEDAAT